MKEELRLVTDFGELRAGMIVVVEFCPMCPRQRGMHRGILVGQERAVSTGEMCWCLAPSPHGGYPHGLVGPGSFKHKVWRVVDPGLESSSHTTTQKPKKLVRAR